MGRAVLTILSNAWAGKRGAHWTRARVLVARVAVAVKAVANDGAIGWWWWRAVCVHQDPVD